MATTVQFTKEFEDWLLKTPEALAKMLEVIKQWYANQNKPLPIGNAPETGPEEFEIGGTPVLQTVGLTHEDLDTVVKGYAKAEVKEKAIIWVKGFLAGVMVAAG